MPTTRQLTVQQAEVTTAAVEVKTLTIRGKQVTLAVFRQLQEEPLVLDGGTLAGTPWGYVNYHPDKCGDRGEHLHIVWQKGNELRRSAEYHHSFSWDDRAGVTTDVGGDWITSAALEGWVPWKGAEPSYDMARWSSSVIRFPSGRAEIDRPEEVSRFFMDLYHAHNKHVGREGKWSDDHRFVHTESEEEHEARTLAERAAAAAQALEKLRSSTPEPVPLSIAQQRVEIQVKEHLAKRAHLARLWADLQSLPQLFIAV